MSNKRQVDVEFTIRGRVLSATVRATPERLRGRGSWGSGILITHYDWSIKSTARPDIGVRTLWLWGTALSFDGKTVSRPFPSPAEALKALNGLSAAIDALNDRCDAEDKAEKAKSYEDRCRGWQKTLDGLEGRCETLLKMVREQVAEIEALRNA